MKMNIYEEHVRELLRNKNVKKQYEKLLQFRSAVHGRWAVEIRNLSASFIVFGITICYHRCIW